MSVYVYIYNTNYKPFATDKRSTQFMMTSIR